MRSKTLNVSKAYSTQKQHDFTSATKTWHEFYSGFGVRGLLSAQLKVVFYYLPFAEERRFRRGELISPCGSILLLCVGGVYPVPWVCRKQVC